MSKQQKERPIIFNDEMVRAILDGRKTQTRRLIEPQPNGAIAMDDVGFGEFVPVYDVPSRPHGIRGPEAVICKYGQPGDRLLVGETITLEITRVHGERLQDIKITDVISEGVKLTMPDVTIDYCVEAEADACFAKLCESIYGRGSWKENPWVWVIEFRRLA